MKKTYNVNWTEVAEKDLVDIIEYIALKNPENALKILNRIKDKVSKLYSFPERGRVVPELHEQGIKKYREIFIPPWRVIFRIAENNVYVMAVIDSRRNIEDVLLKRFVGERI